MEWTAFKTDGSQLMAKEDELFSGKTLAELANLKLNQAKMDLLIDLKACLNLEETDDRFKDMLSTHAVFLKEALSYKQLALYMFSQDMSDGSIWRARYQVYENRYLECRKQFPGLISTRTIYQTQTVRIMR